MRKHKMIAGATALAAFFTVTGLAQAAELTTLTADNKAQILAGPTVILACPADSCGQNEAIVLEQVALHPNLTFVKLMDSEKRGLDPGLYTYVSGVGIVFAWPGFDATKGLPDGFWKQREEFLLKERDAVKAFIDARKAVADLVEQDQATAEQH